MDDREFSAFTEGLPEELITQLRGYAEILADSELLRRAVVVTGGNIAVPVGGSRRGGFVPVQGAETAENVARGLALVEGFPHPWVTLAEDPQDTMDSVHWGETVPDYPDDMDASDAEWARSDVQAGRIYGYTDAAIHAWVARYYSPAVADVVVPLRPA